MKWPEEKAIQRTSEINSIQYLYLVIDVYHIILVNAIILFSRGG